VLPRNVTGYFTLVTSGATYVPLTPARLLDSRNGTGLSGASATYASPVGGATAHVLFEVAGYFQTHD